MFEKVELMRQSNAKQLAQLKKWQKAWDALAKEQSTEKPDPAALKLYMTQLAGWTEVFPHCQNDWIALESSITELYQEMMRRYESELRRVCKQHGYEVEGEFLTFTVDGLVKVNLDKEQNTASVNGKRVTSLSLPVVMERIAGERKRLWERPFDPSAFLKRLHVAYLVVCQRKVVTEGEYVYVRDIYQELKTTDAKYTFELFAADLSRLIESGVTSDNDGNELELAPIRDARLAVYVYDCSARSGRYLGLIRFRRGK